MAETIHNLDQYMSDLRLILAQGKKRIGILLGAGAPASMKVKKSENSLEPLIPTISQLTQNVVKQISLEHGDLIAFIIETIKDDSNIEKMLSKIRALSSALDGSDHAIGTFSKKHFNEAARSICSEIGKIVGCKLPSSDTPYNWLVGWIGGTDREHAVEIFTTNYDLLIEEALETAKVPFFTGFSGFHEPFFDAASISENDKLPSRWARIWKLHGSLGWKIKAGEVIASNSRDASELIYPDHLKYEQVQKYPYTALFDRLRNFLMAPDTLLISCGFSFGDAHISTAIIEALAANPTASTFAFLYDEMGNETSAKKYALQRPNFSAYASDKAIINCIEGKWQLGKSNENREWEYIRESFWASRGVERVKIFTLGDFAAFTKFIALSKSDQTYSTLTPQPNVEALT